MAQNRCCSGGDPEHSPVFILVSSAVGLAHQITITSLVPELKLSDAEVESLAGYLPHVIAGFIQGRRLARGHGGL